MSKIPFDTLKYANTLKRHGVGNAGAHASVLFSAIVQNIYLEHEVDRMIDAAQKRTDPTITEFRESQIKDRARRDKKMVKIQNEMDHKIETAINNGIHRLTINIGIMVSILTAVSLLLYYIH